MKTPRPNHAKRRRTRHDPRLHASRLGKAKEPQAIVVTICTPAYAHLREDAVKRFKQCFGLPVQVIEADDKDGYATKLMLDLHCGPQTVIFCDLDWWPLRPIPPQIWQSGAWCAVRDHGHKHPNSFASHDIAKHRLDALRYFNSGFFVCNLGNPQHVAAFKLARAILGDVRNGKRPKVGDFGEQFYLNAAVQEYGVPLNLLPVGFNWIRGYAEHGMFPYVPRVVYGVHAAGVPLAGKHEHLLAMEKVFGHACAPLCAGVAEEHIAMSVELA